MFLSTHIKIKIWVLIYHLKKKKKKEKKRKKKNNIQVEEICDAIWESRQMSQNDILRNGLK